ncbi:MAG: tRNA dihydrouridine synthase DusB [Candidatus Cloacimonadota bacterium]|nr:MAG: tRNA dihydrouridine synthase DusB [Candidatus Cloacimonadota bacterium]
MIFKPDQLWLAPLAGFTDQAFREICKLSGADITVSEMVSCDGLFYMPERTLPYAVFNENQRPYGIQVFGSDPDIMTKSLDRLIPLKPDFIDLNFGCPVKKVVRRNSGSALMKDPELIYRIVSSMKEKLIKHDIPLTAKIRSGWDSDSVNFLEVSKSAEKGGCDLITIHPRTRVQMFSGKSNWEHIKILKENISVPVAGNGDVISPEDAEEMKKFTGCDSIMIGRGALGKPWIFKLIKAKLNNEKMSCPTSEEIWSIIKKHYELTLKYKEELKALREMRTHICYYTKGLRKGADARNKINKSESADEIFEILENLFDYNKGNIKKYGI